MIQIKAAEFCFRVVMFMMCCTINAALTFESVDEILTCDVPMKATAFYVPLVKFIALHMVVQLFSLTIKF